MQMIQFVDHRLLLYTGPAGGVTNVNREPVASRGEDIVASQMPRIGCDDCCVVAGGFEPAGGVTMDSGGVLLQLHSKSASATGIAGLLIANFSFREQISICAGFR
ncbi:hypothetical protein ACVXHB_04860 [Escherichia coli]